MEPFEQWLQREQAYAAAAMRRCISAVDLVKTRPGFGQTVSPLPGSIVASPVLAAYDPEPDYFFHWFRDSAVVIDALRLLYQSGEAGDEALAQFAAFARFSLALCQLIGGAIAGDASRRGRTAADYLRFLRDDAELSQVRGDLVLAETRVNPDGTLDISKWARPQHDGPPLTALALLRWGQTAGERFDTGLAADCEALIRAHLAFTAAHWAEPSFDIWEEEQGHHYYTLRVAAAALEAGAAWFDARGERAAAQTCRLQTEAIRHRLDGFWLDDEAYYRSRILDSGARSAKELDIAVILSAIHAQGQGGAHSVDDPRMHATLARLEALFDAAYPINHDRGPQRGPALGRYAGDVYYSGGAFYFSTLGAAEFCFRAALTAADRAEWIARGDGYLTTVRAYTPDSGELSEQFDQNSGAQTSARHLAWSYAAFISCVAARRAVLDER